MRLSVLAPLALASGPIAAALPRAREVTPDRKPHRFGFHCQQFTLDGQAIQIRSGQMDPIRIPRSYWRDRIRMARVMGLNTIALYVMWNALEPEPGAFQIHGGRRDFLHFVDLCADEGMWVYLRPGPYVCAEWDFGGLPAWLLRGPDMRVRHGDCKPYMQAVARYFDAIAPGMRKRMVANGGPILMLQLENEYASFGDDLGYLETLQSMWRERGVDGPFSISDGLPQLQKAQTYVPGTALGLDGGTDFAAAQVIAGDAPVWVGEGYTGWLSHWGDDGFQNSDYAATLRKLMDAGRSFNLYEVHGGTNFGFGAGANAHNDGSHFGADLTSYDYGAPIDERGVPTSAYHRLRSIIAGVSARSLPSIPEPPPVFEFASRTAKPWASLWDNLPEAREVRHPAANELLTGQTRGMVLYRKRLRLDRPASLRVIGVHDYATVLVDGRLLGTISRVTDKGLPDDDPLTLPASGADGTQLDILIDSFGHVGFGLYITDRKGLTGKVLINDTPVQGWNVVSLPLDKAYVDNLKPSAQPARRQDVFFRADVEIDSPGDTYIDMSAWDKGYLWVNGHLLGRYWRIGPQQHLYGPAEWWRNGHNDVLIFDQHRTRPASIRGVATLHA
jgi:beta-galactosidase